MRTRPVRPEINLTPLIDVTLVVLIILMVSIPIQMGHLRAKVPGPDLPPPPPEPREQVVVALYAEDSCVEPPCVALNRTSLPASELVAALAEHLPGKPVFVDAHPSVPLSQVVDAMSAAKAAGASTVGLSRLKPEGPRAPLTSFR